MRVFSILKKIHQILTILFLFGLNKVIKNSLHDSFVNDCGPYNGLDNPTIIPTKEDCRKGNSATPCPTGTKCCCYVEAIKDLKKRSSCLLIDDTAEDRISLIKQLSEISTKITVDCGSEKKFESDSSCDSVSKPSKSSDCKIVGGGADEKCCLVKIKSSQFTGNACKKFKNLDINTIGEAVVAAKTVGATLTVECSSFTLKINAILLFFILAIIN